MSYFLTSKSSGHTQEQENVKSLSIFIEKMSDTFEECFIVTDLHDVLLTRIDGDFERFKTLSSKNRLVFLKKLSEYGLKYCLYLLGTSKKPAIENCVTHDCADSKQLQDFIQLISPYVLNNKISDFYLTSARLGIKIIIFSNIGIHSYQYFKEKYPHTFDKLFFVEINANKHNFTLKPHNFSFEILCESLRAMNNGKMPKTILYLDDRIENLKAFVDYLKNAKIEECLYLPYLFTSTSDFEKHYSEKFKTLELTH